MTVTPRKNSFFNRLLSKSAARILSLFPKPRPSVRCPSCALDLRRSKAYKRLRVCERCGHHFPISARKRIELIADPRSFEELDKKLSTRESKSVSAEAGYSKMLKDAQRETHLREGVVTGYATIDRQPTVLIALEFRFMGGSMGAVVGEKIAHAFEYAADEGLPLVAVTTTGGARIQEGMFALMQMAKTAAAAQRLHQKGLSYITVLSHPTTGGVYASFANLADIILAEPGALIGFAGPRVVEALIGQRLPPDSHRAEFLFEHGMVDAIVPRPELRATLSRILKHVTPTLVPSPVQKNIEQERGAQPDQQSPTRPAWEIVNLARRNDRPMTQDYIARVFDDFIELHGDRLFGDDPAIVGGLARFKPNPSIPFPLREGEDAILSPDRRGGGGEVGQSVVVIGHERGHGEEQERRHHGSAEPEGYRKALRLMLLAEKFHLPVITFVDTPGADPSYESEKRGVAMALAHNIGAMSQLATPTIAIVIGEGGSGGALALAVADRVLMLENAIYSVISPEGASAILFGDTTHAQEISNKLRLTAPDLKRLGIIDEIIAEPAGGAQEDADAAAENIRAHLARALAELTTRPIPDLLRARYQKYRRMGQKRK